MEANDYMLIGYFSQVVDPDLVQMVDLLGETPGDVLQRILQLVKNELLSVDWYNFLKAQSYTQGVK